MKLVILLLVMALLSLSLIVPIALLLGTRSQLWTRTVAVAMGLLATSLVVFLFVEDDYTRDGRSNATVYDVEYPAVPSVLLMLAGATWLMSNEKSKSAVVVAPMLALGSGVAAFVCLMFTAN
jgi:hypothetical protein